MVFSEIWTPQRSTAKCLSHVRDTIFSLLPMFLIIIIFRDLCKKPAKHLRQFFVEIVISLQPLTIFTKIFISDLFQSSKCAYEYIQKSQKHKKLS